MDQAQVILSTTIQESLKIIDAKGLNINNYKCYRCKFLLPIFGSRACVNCNKFYCFDCAVALSLKKENCNCKKEFESKCLPLDVVNKISSIILICPNLNHTCRESLLYKNFAEHMYGNSYNSVMCPICINSFPRNQIEDHYFFDCVNNTDDELVQVKLTSLKEYHLYFDKQKFFTKIFRPYGIEQKIAFVYDCLKIFDMKSDIMETTKRNVKDLFDYIIFKVEELQGEKDSSKNIYLFI